MRRVAVIGCGGAGKSTLACRLGRELGLPVVHLDECYWRAAWQPSDAASWEAMQQRLVTADSWIIDGNYLSTLELRLEAADTVVFLDPPAWRCAWRATRRALSGRGSANTAAGCPERLDRRHVRFLFYIWRFSTEGATATTATPCGVRPDDGCLAADHSGTGAAVHATARAMRDYDLADYGERIADVYDDWVQAIDPTDAVDALAQLARGGPVLELGIGTGRIALPLAERGLEVHGIDASEAMLARMREKPGGARIATTVGDLADVAAAGHYPLIFVAANTFFGVLSQDDQVRCFENVEANLLEDGVFVLEAFVPDPTRFDGGRLSVRGVELSSVRMEASLHDPVSQTIAGQAIELREQAARFFPFRLRYAWPAELDLMARLAGLGLRERSGGWGGEPFTAASKQHVSVYERGVEGIAAVRRP